mmetsp:Transcript_5784/g.5240  ORF Transcript_5784/g.5240 Transcript_5784/m.5240 type:complete len:111 (-) Transcript_5784:34-366(-)
MRGDKYIVYLKEKLEKSIPRFLDENKQPGDRGVLIELVKQIKEIKIKEQDTYYVEEEGKYVAKYRDVFVNGKVAFNCKNDDKDQFIMIPSNIKNKFQFEKTYYDSEVPVD